jgi:signal transduction histidine kinase
MAVRAPSQVRIETLVARGRLTLAGFALLSIYFRLPGMPGTPGVTTFTLVFVAYACLIAGLLRTRASGSPHLPGATHALDLTAYAAYVWLLGGPALPALAWFLFVLVAATLRWGWRGAVTTGSVGIAVHIVLGAESSSLRALEAQPLQFIMIALLMGVMTILVGLVGAYEDWRGMQLAKLASWAGPDPDQPTTLPADMLAHTSEVLEAPRTLLIWEEVDEPWTEVAIWDEGRIDQTREPPGSLGDVVAERLAGSSFFCRDVRSSRPLTFIRSSRGGVESWQGMPIDVKLRDRFQIRAVAAWPLRGESFRGWLFCLDRPAFSVQDIALGDVVADLASARLSQAYLVQKLRETVVTTERVRLARDLHDGVLQTLTGAALQLQAARRNLALEPAEAEERLSQVQRIIAAGQNDLRFFINQLGPQRAAETTGPVDLRGRVHELADRIRRQWGVPVTVATEPELLAIPDLLVSDLFLLIHEALVNAARHARASAIQLAILREAHQISIAVADDGQGFPFSGKYTLADLAREQIGPRTLRERVLSLGGTMQLETGEGGSRVRLTVPLAREVA